MVSGMVWLIVPLLVTYNSLRKVDICIFPPDYHEVPLALPPNIKELFLATIQYKALFSQPGPHLALRCRCQLTPTESSSSHLCLPESLMLRGSYL